MLTEGLNININDIEDDELRKEVIKYFKTFKKGKLDDEDLDEVTDDEKKEDEEKENDFSEEDQKNIDKLLSTGLMESLINEEEQKQSDEEIENNMRQTLVAMQTLINTTKKDKKKERLQQHYDFIKNSCFDEKGNFIKDADERTKRGNDALGKMSNMQKIRLVGTLSNSASKEAQDDLKEAYPEEWEKCEKDINKTLKSSKKEDVEKDEDGNVLKQEEITDKDGKKKKVTTHTGPRGGKFYYPDGAPKDAKHKVYIDKSGKVKECMSLRDYLVENF